MYSTSIPSRSSCNSSIFSTIASMYISLSSVYSSVVSSAGTAASVTSSRSVGCGFSVSGERPLGRMCEVERHWILNCCLLFTRGEKLPYVDRLCCGDIDGRIIDAREALDV